MHTAKFRAMPSGYMCCIVCQAYILLVLASSALMRKGPGELAVLANFVGAVAARLVLYIP